MSEAAKVIELAVAAAGNMDKGWRKRVYDNIAEVGAMLREGSEPVEWARRILESAAFQVNYLGFEEEIPEGMDRPSRLIIHTQSDKAINPKPGARQNLTGEEHLRTDPLWTRPGKLMEQRIRELPVGSYILVYKYTETTDDDRKVRVLTHFDVLRTPRSSSGGQAPEPVPASPEAQERPAAAPQTPPVQAPERSPSSPAPEPHSHEDNAALTKIEQLFEKLAPRQRVAYAHWCRGSGITDPMTPDADRVTEAVAELEKLGGES